VPVRGWTMTGNLFPDAPSVDNTFRALSLWQPHAQAVALEIKIYETRHWETEYRGPLVIHAAQKKFRHQDYPRDWYDDACTQLKRAGCPCYALNYGEALCLVDLVDCIPTEQIARMYRDPPFWGDFGPRRFAFKLENVRRIWPPLKVTGRQKFFSVTIPAGNDALRINP
jgi:hypothetical protein